MHIITHRNSCVYFVSVPSHILVYRRFDDETSKVNWTKWSERGRSFWDIDFGCFIKIEWISFGREFCHTHTHNKWRKYGFNVCAIPKNMRFPSSWFDFYRSISDELNWKGHLQLRREFLWKYSPLQIQQHKSKIELYEDSLNNCTERLSNFFLSTVKNNTSFLFWISSELN